MKDLMMDIETLGTDYNSIVVQVAMVYFDRYTKETGKSLVVNIDPISCSKAGLVMNNDTMDWWAQQPKEIQESVLTGGLPLVEALNKIKEFIDYGTIIWCHATFDVPVLATAFKTVGINPPWKYTNVRDLRTIVDLSGIDIKSYKWEEFKTHNALEDCCFQIHYAVDCINTLKGNM